MKIYQVSLDGDPDGHQGFVYTLTAKEAGAAKRQWDSGDESTSKARNADIRAIRIEYTVKGIIRALNIYGGHPDNG